MKDSKLNIYEAPQIEMIAVSDDDVLTLSSGFDGEEDEFMFF